MSNADGNSRNDAFLHEMGLGPVWRRRDAVPAPEAAAPDIAISHGAMSESRRGEPGPGRVPPVAAVKMPEPVHVLVPPSAAPEPSAPASSEVAVMGWGELRDAVAGCVKCGLCRNRKNTVFGVGDEKARWLFIGEGPGRNEDLQGEPFVGPAGKLLDNMLVAMGLRRGENTFIANIVKCRPTDPTGRDRPPAPEEAAACMPYLERQIALIDPTVIVALGKTAALYLLGVDPATPVSKLRGTVHSYAGRPLVVTYHPAYLLRTLTDKKKAWEDLCLAMSTYATA
jgi:DNA polymerase